MSDFSPFVLYMEFITNNLQAANIRSALLAKTTTSQHFTIAVIFSDEL